MAGVRFQHVYKIYDDSVTATKDLNLEICDGEFLVLVGPSGCGKSTVLRMLAGLEEISKGDLFVGDKRVNDLSPRDRDIAMVFQNYALYPHMSVRENMGFSLKLRKTSRTEIAQKVAEAAKILELTGLLDRKPKQLSGGQRQRVAIGRAIVRNPKVFLFDEPLSNLDAKLRVEMRIELAKLHKHLKATIVYVTHDQMEAMTLADRIVLIKDGVIQQVGTPLELYSKPINSFVGGFIGTPAMNQVAANVRRIDGRLALVGQQLQIKLPEDVAALLAKHENQEILIGVRPQHLAIRDQAENAAFSAEIEVVEPMGNESFVYFTAEGKQWVARIDHHVVLKEGTTAAIVVDIPQMHLFSADGSQRLL